MRLIALLFVVFKNLPYEKVILSFVSGERGVANSALAMPSKICLSGAMSAGGYKLRNLSAIYFVVSVENGKLSGRLGN